MFQAAWSAPEARLSLTVIVDLVSRSLWFSTCPNLLRRVRRSAKWAMVNDHKSWFLQLSAVSQAEPAMAASAKVLAKKALSCLSLEMAVASRTTVPLPLTPAVPRLRATTQVLEVAAASARQAVTAVAPATVPF